MKVSLIRFALVSVLLGVSDYVWIVLLMSKRYRIWLSAVVGDQGVRFESAPALIAYILLALGIVFFVLPKLDLSTNMLDRLVWPALFGLIVYGIYNTTNLATLTGWSHEMTLWDTLWGCFVCSFAAHGTIWLESFLQ